MLKQRLETDEVASIQEKVMNIKRLFVDAWLGQIVVTGCEVGIFLLAQAMPAIRLYPPIQVFVSNKISTPRG